MRKFLCLASVLGLSLVAALPATPSLALGLSERQQEHIGVYFKCQTYLLSDLDAFEADPDCGGTPNADIKSLATKTGGEQRRMRYDPCSHSAGLLSVICGCNHDKSDVR